MFIGDFFELIKDILFPPFCISCRGYLLPEEKNDFLCNRCLGTIIVKRCPVVRNGRERIYAACDYRSDPVRELIKIFKYEGLVQAAGPLSDFMIRHIVDSGLLKEIENVPKLIIIPIPLHYSRKLKRGYNQAEELALIIGRKLGIPVRTNAIKRRFPTQPQSRINDMDLRRINMDDAFVPLYDFPDLIGWTVILIDDVYTTGATAKEAIKALYKSGAKEVIVLTAAEA
jgi:competence protein ComFC